ncbi:hypothetical protein Saso_75940 [Streptomyces asoensis]|uniref:Uncharacterized protein n=1 Tax=Streptomyces asoensis TaxID=249586 RepID=A0ABQ3SCT5_9ACTN|nr:hypothetical protein GCM10010496_65170 [Streptomyces asoensis]GHI65944.1 hypothetical protein Saso_75940 [Streptomyces asoensis]
MRARARAGAGGRERPEDGRAGAMRVPAAPFASDYLASGLVKIYLGRSRHWVASQLWFLS